MHRKWSVVGTSGYIGTHTDDLFVKVWQSLTTILLYTWFQACSKLSGTYPIVVQFFWWWFKYLDASYTLCNKLPLLSITKSQTCSQSISPVFVTTPPPLKPLNRISWIFMFYKYIMHRCAWIVYSKIQFNFWEGVGFLYAFVWTWKLSKILWYW